MMSLQALMGIDKNNTQMQKAMERMSSGLRINRAADGAAELSQAVQMQSEQLSNMAAQRNTHDGLSMVQTAEGASGQVGDMLGRMRELSVQASSETINDDQRSMIQTEIAGIQSEMDRIAGVTEFNGVPLADGSNPQVSVQVGTSGDAAKDTIDVKMADLRSSSLGVDSSTVNVSTTGGARSALDAIDTAMDNLNAHRSNYGSAHNRMSSSINQLEFGYIASVEAESRIMDTDYAQETAESAKSQMLMDMGLAVAGQANRINQNNARSLLSS
jgi:flagellin